MKIKSFVAFIIGIVFAVCISEIVLQILDIPPRPISGWLNCKDKNPGECNSMGFRGAEISYSDEDFVVILMGDSEVYAASFLFGQIPERRLEQYLKKHINNVKVFTIADMGYGQDQQFLALKKYFESHRADLVLLMFTARNDVDNNYWPTSGANDSIKPTFWLENGELQGPTEGWLERVGPQLKLVSLWNRYFGQTIAELRLGKWKEDILPTPYQPLKQYEGEVDYSWQELWNKYPQTALKGIEYERVGESIKWTPRSAMREYGINLTRKLFSEIKKITEANKAHFLIFKEERPWELQSSVKDKAYFLKGNYYRMSTKQYQANLQDLFDGFEHCRIPLNMENYRARPEDFHLNQQAVDKLMEEISNTIIKREYFKEK